MEAKELTARNLKIAQIYSETVADIADGVLLSGSNAWGANYAVTSTSDIDLLIAGSLDTLKKVIERLISKKLVVERESERFEIFRKLCSEKRAEQFSTIATYSDTKVSLDFMPWSAVEDICNLRPMTTQQTEGIDVRTIKEFRINTPKDTGYFADNLSGKKKLTYYSKFKDMNGGYLADTLVDAQTDGAYFIGVMSFFFAIHPVVLIDREKKLKNSIRALQTNIARILGGRLPAYVTRQERMSNEMLESVIKSLSQG